MRKERKLNMDKKRAMLYNKVLENIADRSPETADFFEDNLKELCKNEKISVDEVFYSVALLFSR